MIPPLQEVRLRSIRRWLKDQQPEWFAQLTQSGELETEILAMDESMDQAFEEAESEIMTRLDRSKRWGTQAGLQEFNTERLALWGEIRERFLPVIIIEE